MSYFNHNVGRALFAAADLAMIVSFAACGSSSSDAQSSTGNVSSDSSDGKSIVVYFSASGNTKNVAEDIADALGAPTFELIPRQPYTDDDLNWRDSDSRVVREYEDESLQDVKLSDTSVPDWDTYTTVYLGFPIWWMNPAWPVNDFVTSNNFTGKTIIPFCTSASSGIDDSAATLEKLAGTGTWLTGHRFTQNEDVAEWLSQTENGTAE